MKNQKSLSPLNWPSRNVEGSTLSEKEKIITFFFFHLKGKISLIKVNIEYKKLMNQLSKLHIVVIQSLSGI